MPSSLSQLVYHLVFSTKKRAPLITPVFRVELYRYMGGILKQLGGALLEIGGTTDHIHMVVRLKPVHALADVMRCIKGGSSKWANAQKRLPNRFAWQEGYGVFSISESHVARVRQYVRNQEEHHAFHSFKDEYVRLLERHDIDYNPEYLWR